MQTRKSAKDNFTYALLLGVAEAKLKGESIEKFDANPYSTDYWKQATKFCSDISQQIESGMWVCYNSELNKEYSRKFRQLQASLRNDDNYELRL